MEAQNDSKPSGQILRHFFDDWPRQQLEENENATSMASATSLSISMPGNSSSDVSLKLSTGDRHNSGTGVHNVERSMWGSTQVAPMGGPLAEALRSSMSSSSPTSVLHHLPRGSTSEASYVTTWSDKWHCWIFFNDWCFGTLCCVTFFFLPSFVLKAYYKGTLH